MTRVGARPQVAAAIVAVCLLCLMVLPLGWHFGYRSSGMYVSFWILSASVALTGVTVGRFFPWNGVIDAVIRFGVVAFAVIVLAGLVLGGVGLLAVPAYGILLVALFCSSLLVKSLRPPVVLAAVPNLPSWVVAASATMFAFVVAYGISQSPLTLYDSLSYHLLFPARWLQEHRLSIIATPFSDEAQAYAPANGELYFLWLMLPFHGDLLARIGQVPFYFLGGVALYALARRIGAPPEHAVYVPAFFFLSRPIVEQAVGADVDLICWATFLSALYLGIAAVDSNDRRDWMLWGVSVGLYLGSKFVALIYSPVLLIFPLVRGGRVRAFWALAGIAGFALPWYFRNWLIAGSPVYPASLKIAGTTIAQGAFSRDAMLNSVFHTTDFRLFPVMVSHAFGTTLVLFWLPFAALGAWSLLTRKRWWPGVLVLCIPLLMIPLYWFGVPDNVDSRFLLPAAVLALVPMAFAFRTSKAWNLCVHAAYAGGIVWLLVGANSELPADLPWYMGGWLSLQGLLNRRYWILFLATVALLAMTWTLLRNARFGAPILATVCGLAPVLLVVGADKWCAASQCDFLQVSSTFIRLEMNSGWDWVHANTHDATVAYTGNNVPYPLFGSQLTNRVYYVNIDRHLTWRFHDYDRAIRRRRADVTLVQPLATSSGVLRPALKLADGQVDAARPRYERMDGYRDAWLENLKQLGVDHLFVSTLSAYESNYVWHNEQGFPIEDEWAKADPAVFRLVYENPQVRIYDVHVH